MFWLLSIAKGGKGVGVLVAKPILSRVAQLPFIFYSFIEK
tara:strand:+ start:309 stop:428 length:120 start_codon:yes stop_codon:yes gene_type:complete